MQRSRIKNVLKAQLSSILTGVILFTTSPVTAASLYRNIIVDSKNLKVGDIFDGAGQYANKIVGRAPEPGRRFTLEARWLAYVANSYNINWKPLSTEDRAVVERASHVIGQDEIKAKILSALKSELSAQEKYSITFNNRLTALHLPTDVTPSVTVQKIERDKISNRFFAVLTTPKHQPGARRYTITGKLFRMVEIPIVTRRVRKGDIIEKDDVQTISIRVDKLGRNVLMSKEELIGKSPKRTLIEHRPIRTSDVREPVLVRRSSLVTMVYQTRFMRISARGKAKQSGSLGDTVRVLNSGSKKVVEGTVTGPSEITVTANRPITLN
ncbi:MAG: flagella basal body P-ring formation protein FlgA [Rhodospirillaceae bacterium]|nr:flagella basal body P-ring formation protein FlgA [Rhodospirillaceae bacterium]